jgi:hypothetical protein
MTGSLLHEIDRFGPDLLCYGTTTGLHRYYMRVKPYIKSHRKESSPCSAACIPPSSRKIIRDPAIDAVCIGEGELALVELANRLQAGESVAGRAEFLRQGRTVRSIATRCGRSSRISTGSGWQIATSSTATSCTATAR